jgi:Ser/Thr protein kinase RdoA (MazF antagonist)
VPSSGSERVRVDGAVVRRRTGPWTPFVHALLRRLPDGIGPRPVGLEGEWETLTLVPGAVGERPLSDEARSDDALVSTARLLRRFHDAAPGVCHNDVGPWNVVFDGPSAVGLIDWDQACPGPARSDVALALWHFAPLYDDAECVRIGWPEPPDRVARVRRFCAAYGTPVDAALWESVAARQRWYLRQVLAAVTAPHAPGASAWLKVDPALVRRDMAWLAAFLKGGLPWL